MKDVMYELFNLIYREPLGENRWTDDYDNLMVDEMHPDDLGYVAHVLEKYEGDFGKPPKFDMVAYEVKSAKRTTFWGDVWVDDY